MRKNFQPTLISALTLAAFLLWALLPHFRVTSHRHAHGEDHGHHFPKEYYTSEETGSWTVTDNHTPGEDFGTGHYHEEAFHQHTGINPGTEASKPGKATYVSQSPHPKQPRYHEERRCALHMSHHKPGRKASNDNHGSTEKKSHKDAEYADRHTTEEVERKTTPRHGLGAGPWLTKGKSLPHSHYWEDLNLSYLTSEVAEAVVSLSEPPYREPRYTLPDTRSWFVYSPRGPPLS